jgi:hypothetical protein
VVPLAAASRVFGEDGQVRDPSVGRQLRTLGAETVRVAEKFALDASAHRGAECERAAERVALSG